MGISRQHVVLALLLLASACAASSRDNGVGALGTSRALLATDFFPFCRCTDYSCESSPYGVDVKTTLTAAGTEVTLKITKTTLSITNTGGCYGDLTNMVHRIALESRPECSSSWSNVRVNGVTTVPAPLFKPYPPGAELKILFSPLSYYDFIGSTVTFTLSGACPDLNAWTGYPGVTFSFAESNNNKCCPVCHQLMLVPAQALSPASRPATPPRSPRQTLHSSSRAPSSAPTSAPAPPPRRLPPPLPPLPPPPLAASPAPPRRLPPPPSAVPPSASLPCVIDIEFCVTNPAGVANPTVPPYPTAATCALLKAYANSQGTVVFSCLPVNTTAAKTCVKVTGTGSLQANDVCYAASAANFAGMYAAVGYGSYTCNLEGKSVTTCGCMEQSATAACANFSPPPRTCTNTRAHAPDFPWCECNRNAESGWYVQFMGYSAAAKPDKTKVSFELRNSGGYASPFPVGKMHFAVKDAGFRRVDNVVFDGKPRGAGWDIYPGNNLSFKITQFGSIPASRSPIPFSFDIQVDTLAEFFTANVVSIFEYPNFDLCPNSAIRGVY
ncbi:hypothetical protein FOA52_015094 [Chlamydomonas sp. UWO 241]|nr:hypothetical protein FOA52_015094 [Chlamydomonas sp. UWO 241]